MQKADVTGRNRVSDRPMTRNRPHGHDLKSLSDADQLLGSDPSHDVEQAVNARIPAATR